MRDGSVDSYWDFTLVGTQNCGGVYANRNASSESFRLVAVYHQRWYLDSFMLAKC